jgi:hypothetical protein
MLGDALYPAAYIVEDGIDIVWFRDGQRKPPGEIAVVGSTAPGKFRVVTCTATIETPPPIP